MQRSNYLIGYTLAILAALGFSSKAIFVKLAYQDAVGAVTLLALRMTFSMLVFAVVAWHYARSDLPPTTPRQRLAILVLGLLGYYLSSLFDFIGLQSISAGLERLILFLYPTFVLLLSAALFGKRIALREWLALLFSYTGIAIVFVGEVDLSQRNLWQGVAWVFASTVTYAAYLIGTGETVRGVGASRFTAYAMLVASFATLLHFVSTQPVQALLQLSPRVYQLTLWMALIATVLPVFMLSSAIQRIGSSRASLIGSLGPVATLFLANKVLGEQLSQQQLMGAGLVMLGVLLLSKR